MKNTVQFLYGIFLFKQKTGRSGKTVNSFGNTVIARIACICDLYKRNNPICAGNAIRLKFGGTNKRPIR